MSKKILSAISSVNIIQSHPACEWMKIVFHGEFPFGTWSISWIWLEKRLGFMFKQRKKLERSRRREKERRDIEKR